MMILYLPCDEKKFWLILSNFTLILRFWVKGEKSKFLKLLQTVRGDSSDQVLGEIFHLFDVLTSFLSLKLTEEVKNGFF